MAGFRRCIPPDGYRPRIHCYEGSCDQYTRTAATRGQRFRGWRKVACRHTQNQLPHRISRDEWISTNKRFSDQSRLCVPHESGGDEDSESGLFRGSVLGFESIAGGVPVRGGEAQAGCDGRVVLLPCLPEGTPRHLQASLAHFVLGGTWHCGHFDILAGIRRNASQNPQSWLIQAGFLSVTTCTPCGLMRET